MTAGAGNRSLPSVIQCLPRGADESVGLCLRRSTQWGISVPNLLPVKLGSGVQNQNWLDSRPTKS